MFSCWISSWSLSCVVWSMMLWISLFLDSKLDEMWVSLVWSCILELILWSLGSICFLGWVWSCGELRRHNVTRQCDPQGGSGRLRRRRLIRRGRPSPSCGGDWRKGEHRECVPHGSWEFGSSEQFLVVVVCCWSFVSDYCWIVYWVFYTIAWSIDSCLRFPLVGVLVYWFSDSWSGSWLVFIFEMNPRFGWLWWCWSMVVMVDYWLLFDYWLLTSGCGLGTDCGPCRLLLTSDFGLRPWYGLRSMSFTSGCGLGTDCGPCRLLLTIWLLTCDIWVTWLMVGWEVDVGMSFFVGSYEFFALFGWYLVILLSLDIPFWIVFSRYLIYGSSLPYAFVVGYWIDWIESWFVIRSVYPCWVSICTVVQFVGVYILYGCVNLFTTYMYIYTSLRVWMVVT